MAQSIATGVPYRLRRSASHGLAQGVLAVPSVLAALVAAAPTGELEPAPVWRRSQQPLLAPFVAVVLVPLHCHPFLSLAQQQ